MVQSIALKRCLAVTFWLFVIGAIVLPNANAQARRLELYGGYSLLHPRRPVHSANAPDVLTSAADPDGKAHRDVGCPDASTLRTARHVKVEECRCQRQKRR